MCKRTFIPVCGISLVGTVEIDHTVEPAIWFKSLIIDSMYIDCDSRNVFWREKSQDDNTESELEEPSPFVPQMTRAIYDDGDCEDFELFDAVVKLLKAIEHKTFSGGQRLVIRYPFQHHREARPENQHCKS
jgi:hypothetical protein